jgi:hypothetical protein
MIRNRNKRRDSENRKGTKRKKRTKAEMVKKEGKSSRVDTELLRTVSSPTQEIEFSEKPFLDNTSYEEDVNCFFGNESFPAENHLLFGAGELSGLSVSSLKSCFGKYSII